MWSGLHGPSAWRAIFLDPVRGNDALEGTVGGGGDGYLESTQFICPNPIPIGGDGEGPVGRGNWSEVPRGDCRTC